MLGRRAAAAPDRRSRQLARRSSASGASARRRARGLARREPARPGPGALPRVPARTARAPDSCARRRSSGLEAALRRVPGARPRSGRAGAPGARHRERLPRAAHDGARPALRGARGARALAAAGRAGAASWSSTRAPRLTVDAVEVAAGARPALPRRRDRARPALARGGARVGTRRACRGRPRARRPALGARHARGDPLRRRRRLPRRRARARSSASRTRPGSPGAVAIVITGGARAFLLEPEPFVRRGGERRPLVVDPELVHRGLLAALAIAPRIEREDPP